MVYSIFALIITHLNVAYFVNYHWRWLQGDSEPASSTIFNSDEKWFDFLDFALNLTSHQNTVYFFYELARNCLLQGFVTHHWIVCKTVFSVAIFFFRNLDWIRSRSHKTMLLLNKTEKNHTQNCTSNLINSSLCNSVGIIC